MNQHSSATSSVPPPSTNYSDIQTMMVLSALAATEGLHSESVQAQQGDIQTIINDQLSQLNMPWRVIWVGLTNDLANLSYIAQSTANSDVYAVAIRGTLPGNTIDRGEDMHVHQTVSLPFTVGGKSGTISEGAGATFTEVTGAVYAVAEAPLSGTTLEAALSKQVSSATSTPTIYVTGHSLGGAAATVLGLYLAAAVKWQNNTPIFQVYTFAAPTAGLDDFAGLFNTAFEGSSTTQNSAWRVYNVWDVVPAAWVKAQLDDVKSWYAWGPVATLDVRMAIGALEQLISSGLGSYLPYTQPGPNLRPYNQIPPNGEYPPQYDPSYMNSTTADFKGQAGFQHANNTYLSLLSGPSITPVPGAPTGVSLTVKSASEIDLTWTAPAESASSGPVNAYAVMRSTTEGSGYLLVTTLDASTLSYNDQGLDATTTYYYIIQATNALGASPASAEASATTA